MLQLHVLVERTLRPVGLVALVHLTDVVPRYLVGSPPHSLPPLIRRLLLCAVRLDYRQHARH